MIALKDLDGTVKGLAVLVGVPMDDPDGKVFQDRFVESETQSNPALAADMLRDSTQQDFPGYSFVIATNERAKYLLWAHRMKQLLGADHDASISDYREASHR